MLDSTPVESTLPLGHILSPADSNAKPGLLERWGRDYFERIGSSYQAELSKEHLELSTDASQERSRLRRDHWAVWVASIIAFVAGCISAYGSVWVALKTADQGFWWNWFWILLVTAVLSLAEFVVLFYISLWVVARIAVLSGIDAAVPDPVYRHDRISSLLSRAALEIPDPVMHVLGIDPLQKVSKHRLLIIGILYKLKIAASNLLARVLLTRLFGKYVLRVSVAYIAVPVTGFWNAWVTVKVARDARLRLYGQRAVRHLCDKLKLLHGAHPLSADARLGVLQAAGNAVVLTQNYHPNMLLLMLALIDVLGLPEEREVPRLDDWGNFLQTLSVLSDVERKVACNVLVVAAALDGTFSALERRELDDAFGSHHPLYFSRISALRDALQRGQLSIAVLLCNPHFDPSQQ
jgi:hypothetical protein